nr:NifU family protein [Tenacibaculum sp.]
VMKFTTNKDLSNTDVEIKNIEEANKISPLASEMFNFPFVKEVFISENYISITKHETVEWENISNEIKTFIRDYIKSKKIIISKHHKESKEQQNEISKENLDETSKKIIDILDEYIKPAVASDGGNIAFKSYDKETKQVSVILQGACSGCPASTITLKNGIETTLKKLLPNLINEVVAING